MAQNMFQILLRLRRLVLNMDGGARTDHTQTPGVDIVETRSAPANRTILALRREPSGISTPPILVLISSLKCYLGQGPLRRQDTGWGTHIEHSRGPGA